MPPRCEPPSSTVHQNTLLSYKYIYIYTYIWGYVRANILYIYRIICVEALVDLNDGYGTGSAWMWYVGWARWEVYVCICWNKHVIGTCFPTVCRMANCLRGNCGNGHRPGNVHNRKPFFYLPNTPPLYFSFLVPTRPFIRVQVLYSWHIRPFIRYRCVLVNNKSSYVNGRWCDIVYV